MAQALSTRDRNDQSGRGSRYACDVLVGTGIGFGIRYAVPVLRHYSHKAQQTAIGPDLTCGGTGLGVGGTF